MCGYISGVSILFPRSICVIIEGNVCCGFVIYSFYYIEVCSFCAYFLQTFYHKWVLNFVKVFLCTYWNNHMVFIFQFVAMVYHIDWFANTEEHLHPCYKTYLVMMCVWSFKYVVGLCLLEFCWLFLHLCGIFDWFWYQRDSGLVEWVWEFSSLCNFLEEFE